LKRGKTFREGETFEGRKNFLLERQLFLERINIFIEGDKPRLRFLFTDGERD